MPALFSRGQGIQVIRVVKKIVLTICKSSSTSMGTLFGFFCSHFLGWSSETGESMLLLSYLLLSIMRAFLYFMLNTTFSWENTKHHEMFL